MRGLMPALLTLDSPQSWTRWWDGYVATYLERDLRQVAQIDALLDFRKTMELVALRSGQLLKPIRSGPGCPACPANGPPLSEPARNNQSV